MDVEVNMKSNKIEDEDYKFYVSKNIDMIWMSKKLESSYKIKS